MLLAILPACISHASRPPERGPESAAASSAPASDRAALRDQLVKARAALGAGDKTQARELAAATVAGLLPLAAGAVDEEPLELLVEAGRCARAASDPRTAHAAFGAVLDALSARKPAEHTRVLMVKKELAACLAELGDLPAARGMQEQVLSALEATCAEADPALVSARGELAATLRALGDLHGACELADRALASLPTEERSTAKALPVRAVRARAIAELGRLAEAREELGAVVAALERAGAIDETLLASAHQDHGVVLAGLGELSVARVEFERALAIRERILPPDHGELLRSRMNLGGILEHLGEHEASHLAFESAHAAMVRTLPEDHPDLQRARINLSTTCARRGDAERACELLESAVEVLRRTHPGEHPLYLTARYNLASHRQSLGDLAGARALLEDVLRVRERVLPQDHPDVQDTRVWLGVMLLGLGDVRAARARFEQAAAALARSRPPEDFRLLRARRLLAEAHLTLGELEHGEELAQEVVDILERSAPLEHPEFDEARTVLAMASYRTGEFERARDLIQPQVERAEGGLSPRAASHQRARSTLACSLAALGEVEAARALQAMELDERSRALGDDHPDTLGCRKNLLMTLATSRPDGTRLEGADAAIGEHLRSLVTGASNAARRSRQFGSVREAEDRAASFAPLVDCILSFTRPGTSAAGDELLQRRVFAFLEELRGGFGTAGHLARASRRDARHAELRDRVREASARIARLVRAGTTGAELETARLEKEEAEQELALRARELSGDDAGNIEPDALAARIDENAAFVGFRDYVRWDPDARHAPPWFATLSVCAFVLRSDGSLKRIELGPAPVIEAAIAGFRSSTLGADELLALRGRAVEARTGSGAAQSGSALRSLVLDPLREALAGVDRLLVCLDGPLHGLALEALPSGPWSKDERALVGDVLRIDRLSSARELFSTARRPDSSLRALLVGGIDYGAAEPDAGGFEPLPGSERETEEVVELLRSVRVPVEQLTGTEATRERFVERAEDARWIHVAAHGFSRPADEAVSARAAEAPPARSAPPIGLRIERSYLLAECGLAFAGARRPGPGGESRGLLTAEELSALDLSLCELAVLSACDTHVGSASRAGQGVASMQKALHMAGARSVVTSLWKVPDEATKELMLEFYRRLWVAKEPKWKALWEAKRTLRDACDSEGNPRFSTRDWAAWVLTGAPD